MENQLEIYVRMGLKVLLWSEIVLVRSKEISENERRQT